MAAHVFTSCAKAAQTLTRGATTDLIADGDTITIGATTYRFKTTLAQAQDIKCGAASDAGTKATLTSLAKTMNGTGTVTTDYYTASTTPHPTAAAYVAANGLTFVATALMPGLQGNHIPTTEVIVDAQITWGAAAMAGGTGNPTAKIETFINGLESAHQIPADLQKELIMLEDDLARVTSA